MTTRKGSQAILIVEDSPTQAERLKYLLEQHGYQITVASNGREAVDLLAKFKPRLVISDIIMPEMDGYQLCRFMRADPNLASIPLILLTALSDPIDVMRALECGADNFIIKPFDEEHLLERVQLFLLHHDLHKHERVKVGLEIMFQGQKFFINSDRLQILNLLLSTYEAAVEKNGQLLKAQTELQDLAAELETQSEELQRQNENLRNLTEELRKSEGHAQRQAQILTGINRVFHEALTNETEEELGRTCLAVAEELTGSQFGFLAEINPDGLLENIAISDPGWAACRMPGTNQPVAPKGFHIRGIFGQAIKEERSVITNDPAAHPDRVGTPAGHPPLTAFLGVPLKQAGKTIGMIGLGNKPGGYDLADQSAAEALAPAIVESFLRNRAEARIKELNEDLLLHVRQLETANKELNSFTYSVSHDLKAPVRAIQGFSRMLAGEHAAQLDAEGLRLLKVIIDNTKLMHHLIDDLLALSRLGRHEIRKGRVNLTAMARQRFRPTPGPGAGKGPAVDH